MNSSEPSTTDPAIRLLAESLSAASSLAEPAESWWCRWLELQRRLGLESSKVVAAETIVKIIGVKLGKAPLRELSMDRLRTWISGEVSKEALPDPLAAILATPGDAIFFDRWVALVRVAGFAPSNEADAPRVASRSRDGS